jgi:hypothetical protein
VSHTEAHDDTGHADDDELHAAGADAHDEPLLDEPKTPLWLTALGGGLFFLLAVAWLAGLASEPRTSEGGTAATASAAAASASAIPPTPKAPPPPPPTIAAAPPPIPPPPPPIPAPGAGAAKAVKKAVKAAPGTNP